MFIQEIVPMPGKSHGNSRSRRGQCEAESGLAAPDLWRQRAARVADALVSGAWALRKKDGSK